MPQEHENPCAVSDTIANDRLETASEIVQYLYGVDSAKTRKRVYYGIKRGVIPAGRWHGRLVASKRALRARYKELTNNIS